MTVEIRLAAETELESIWQIYSAAVGQGAVRKDAYWKELTKRGGMVVAETEHRVVGFGGIDPEAGEQMKYLYVLPGCQRLGIGTKLLRRLEEIGRENGLHDLVLHANPEAVDFYRRAGYHTIDPGPASQHDHGGLVMVKRIQPLGGEC